MHDTSKGARQTRQVSDLLKPGSSNLGRLLARAREVERLDRKLRNLLQPDIAARTRVANLRDGCLVLVTPSAALATRLRMDSAQLLEALHANGERPIGKIMVRVAPLPGAGQQTPRRRELPEIARRSLERFAEDCNDAELRAILERGTGPSRSDS